MRLFYRLLLVMLFGVMAPVGAVANTAYDNLVLSDANIVSYFPLAANTTDLVPASGYSLLTQGAPTFGSAVATNITGYVATSNNYIWTGGVCLTCFYPAAFPASALEIWFKETSSTGLQDVLGNTFCCSAWQVIIVSGDNSRCGAGVIEVVYVGTGAIQAVCGPSVSLGTAYHIVVNCTGSGGPNATCQAFVNASSIGTNTFAIGSRQPPQNDTYMGNQNNTQFVVGATASVAVYQGQMSGAEITAHYNCGIGAGGACANVPNAGIMPILNWN